MSEGIRPSSPAGIRLIPDVVLEMPPGLSEYQAEIARIALANIPPAPRAIPPRITQPRINWLRVGAAGLALFTVMPAWVFLPAAVAIPAALGGAAVALAPQIVARQLRHVVLGARGVGRVDKLERIQGYENGQRQQAKEEWRATFTYLAPDGPRKAEAVLEAGDYRDVEKARVIPIVVDLTNFNRTTAYLSALDVR